MSRFPRLSILVCLQLALILVPGVTNSSAAAPTTGSLYLAMGDSLAAGVGAAGLSADSRCRSIAASGYVCVVYRYLRHLNPDLKLDNIAVSGADSCVLVHGMLAGSPCTDPLVHAVEPSQLDEALALIKAHPGQVSPITVDIGGDDLAALLPTALHNPGTALQQLPKLLSSYRQNLDAVLAGLHSAEPGATVLVINQFDPLGGLGTPPLPPGIGFATQGAVSALNAIMDTEAAAHGDTYVDVATAFKSYPGGAYSLTYLLQSSLLSPNIHPTPKGYVVYAQAVLNDAGYALPSIILHVHLQLKRVRAGGREAVLGSTVPGAGVTIANRYPGRRATRAIAHVSSTGTFVDRFWVGKVRGRGEVTVCATADLTKPGCRPLTYHVR